MLSSVFKKQQQPEVVRKVMKLIFEPDKKCVEEYAVLLNSLYGLQFTNDLPVFTFGIMSEGNDTIFYIVFPEQYENIFIKKYAAINSYIQFEEIEDPLIAFVQKQEKEQLYNVSGYEMKLLKEDENKHLKMKDAERQFMPNLLNAMNNAESTDRSIVEISIQAVAELKDREFNNKLTKGLFTVTDCAFKGLGFILDTCVMNGQLSKREEELPFQKRSEKNNQQNQVTLLKFNTNIRLMSKSIDIKCVEDNIKGMSAVFSDLSDGNSLVPIKLKYEHMYSRNMKNSSILTTYEIVQFLHLPDKSISAGNIQSSNCKKLQDRNVANEGLVFGDWNNVNVAFPMEKLPLSKEEFKRRYKAIERIVDNRSKPILILGQQGTGKSEFIINFTLSLAAMNMGVFVVDPKNDTQQRLIESLPEEYLSRLVYINFGDTQYPPSMNIFRKRHENDPTENSLIVTSFISLMKKEFSKNWGFKIQRTLQMTAEAILLHNPSTLNEFELMLTEREFREYMIEFMKALITDEEVKGKAHIKKLIRYWEQFNSLDDKVIVKEVEPVMNQIGVFLSNRVIKSIVSQNESFDFRKAADEGKIIIINLPEGVLGDNTKLLSSMVNKAIWLDIQTRANQDLQERFPVGWIIDEAHELVDDEFIGVLTKARAYRLGLVLATQGLTNFKHRGMDDIRELILTNCKNKITFRLGAFDSRDLCEEFQPLTPNDLQNCPDYHFYGKILLETGKVSDPFFAHALYPAKKLRNYDQFLMKHRSGKHTVDEVEDMLEQRMDHIIVMKRLLKAK